MSQTATSSRRKAKKVYRCDFLATDPLRVQKSAEVQHLLGISRTFCWCTRKRLLLQPSSSSWLLPAEWPKGVGDYMLRLSSLPRSTAAQFGLVVPQAIQLPVKHTSATLFSCEVGVSLNLFTFALRFIAFPCLASASNTRRLQMQEPLA